MLRYKTETRPGLVALYDIRPENWAGQFLQPLEPARGGQFQGSLGKLVTECWKSWILLQQKMVLTMTIRPSQITTNITNLSFYRQMPFLLPNEQCQSTEGIMNKQWTNTKIENKRLLDQEWTESLPQIVRNLHICHINNFSHKTCIKCI